MSNPAVEIRAPSGPTFDSINERLTYSAGRLIGRDGALELRTVLQPIFSVRHQRSIGCEALIRGRDVQGREVPAWKVFSGREEVEELALDRLCAVLHCRNFSAIAADRNWLFLRDAVRDQRAVFENSHQLGTPRGWFGAHRRQRHLDGPRPTGLTYRAHV